MGKFIQMLGEQAAGNIVGEAIGIGLQPIKNKQQLKQQKKLQAMQIAGSKELTDYNQKKQMEMWRDTSYGPQIEQMEKAGLNPGLMYGMGGGGGQTAQLIQGQAGGGHAETARGMGINPITSAQLKMIEAQTENIKADTANKGADTQNKGYQGNLLQLEQDLKTDLYQAGVEKGKAEANEAIHQSIVKYWERTIADNAGPVQSYYASEKAKEEYMNMVLTNLKTQENTKLTTEQINKVQNDILIAWKQIEQQGRALDQKDQDILIDKAKNSLIEKGIEWGAASQIAGDLIKVFFIKGRK